MVKQIYLHPNLNSKNEGTVGPVGLWWSISMESHYSIIIYQNVDLLEELCSPIVHIAGSVDGSELVLELQTLINRQQELLEMT